MKDIIIITVRREYPDGSVRELSESFDPALLKAIKCKHNGFPVRLYQYYRAIIIRYFFGGPK